MELINEQEIASPVVKFMNLSQYLKHVFPSWNCKKHDKGLLLAASRKGFKCVKDIFGNEAYGFEDIKNEFSTPLDANLIFTITEI
jgi:hypothetical protein